MCVRACRAEEVRLLAEDKEMLGIFGLEEAIEKAEDVGLDVVLISADASPPVCRMMDASKYKYELDKRDKEAKKKQREARCACPARLTLPFSSATLQAAV